MKALDEATRQAVVDLQQTIANFWWEVDANRTRNVTDFFTEDCAFEPGTGSAYTGRTGVRAFYDERLSQGDGTVRHLIANNIRVALDSPTRASVGYFVVIYVGMGPPPVLGLDRPQVLLEYDCVCERDAAGCWRFAQVRAKPIFISAPPSGH